MFRRFGYPISETLRKGIWVLDFHLGDFANVGMAGIFWLNRQDYGYFGHEIYLLPGQMIPEHQHLATDKGPAKMESWQPRHGMIYTFGEGEPTPEFFAKIPASQRDIVKSRHCKPLTIDEVGDLNRREAWHFMVAGPGRRPGDRVRHLSRHGRAEVLQPQGEGVSSDLRQTRQQIKSETRSETTRLNDQKMTRFTGPPPVGSSCSAAICAFRWP